MYIAMELGGECLEDYHRRHNPDLFNLLKGAARALAQFHNRKKSLFNLFPKIEGFAFRKQIIY